MIHLIIGGVRSGKSSYAEKQVLAQSNVKQCKPCYIATATAEDAEMACRIAHHQSQRDMSFWQLHECPLNLPRLITTLDDNHCYLVDCLTLWLNNILMLAVDKQQNELAISQFINSHVTELLDALESTSVDITVVTNEVGQGIVPINQQSRLFVDHAGWLNQRTAALAAHVTLIIAGLPVTLKPVNTSISPHIIGSRDD
mgnify:CR=1 FL=1